MKTLFTLLGLACALGDASQVSACSSPGPVSLSYAVERAEIIVAGTITGQSAYERTRASNLQVADVSTVVFDVERVLRGDVVQALEFIAINEGDRIARNLGNRFIVALAYTDRQVFTPDDRFGDTADLPMLMTACGTYMFPIGEITDLSGRFLLEIFDGDGDPAEEAAVFDRYLRGSGLY
ncbi:hypothetical protein Q4555_07135 [Octadecabacter sp. 1_MG-2023]|uniref:hypothetical protein n=1 Tax=unclassified Octadecabacter TaxID=196158 RepID=UPI001C0A5817|nr:MULTISPECIES: hypothetical protein [unclassified Octadecabacter]MBU2994274.1 hypothetical protein [Octadecabacter sp. B2R22]MDO6734437.1 hypothetical protein [Octadecabacter sp. 1_MG-2023]